jgi:hypothetical protein
VEAVVLNIKLEKGSPWFVGFSLDQESDGVISPFPLTGWIGVSSIKWEATSAESIATPVVTITDEATGTGEISLSGAATISIPTTGKSFTETTSAVWDAYLVHPTSPLSPLRLYNGSVQISPTVTTP